MVALIGTQEVPGPGSNPIVVQFAKDCGHTDVNDDATPWCAFSLGSCLVKSKYPIPPVAVNGLARSYARYGIALDGPKPGAICVWSRNNSAYEGHVNICESVAADGKSMVCVGGNQGAAGVVSRVTYNLPAANLLAYRWPPPPITIAGAVQTAATSKRFMTSITGSLSLGVGVLMHGFDSLFNGIGALFDQLPGMHDEAEGLISTNQEMLGWVGVPWAKVGIAVTAACLMFVAFRHFAEKWADQKEGTVTGQAGTIPTTPPTGGP